MKMKCVTYVVFRNVPPIKHFKPRMHLSSLTHILTHTHARAHTHTLSYWPVMKRTSSLFAFVICTFVFVRHNYQSVSYNPFTSIINCVIYLTSIGDWDLGLIVCTDATRSVLSFTVCTNIYSAGCVRPSECNPESRNRSVQKKNAFLFLFFFRIPIQGCLPPYTEFFLKTLKLSKTTSRLVVIRVSNSRQISRFYAINLRIWINFCLLFEKKSRKKKR